MSIGLFVLCPDKGNRVSMKSASLKCTSRGLTRIMGPATSDMFIVISHRIELHTVHPIHITDHSEILSAKKHIVVELGPAGQCCYISYVLREDEISFV